MEEFDIREATPEDAEKIIAYLAQVGGETDYLSFGKEGLTISTEEEEKFIQNINKEEHSVLYVVWKNGEIIGCQSKRIFQKDDPPRRIRNLCGQVGMGAGNWQGAVTKMHYVCKRTYDRTDQSGSSKR